MNTIPGVGVAYIKYPLHGLTPGSVPLTRAHTGTHTHANAHTYAHPHIRTHTRDARAYIHVCAYIRVHVGPRTYTHTHTGIHNYNGRKMHSQNFLIGRRPYSHKGLAAFCKTFLNKL